MTSAYRSYRGVFHIRQLMRRRQGRRLLQVLLKVSFSVTQNYIVNINQTMQKVQTYVNMYQNVSKPNQHIGRKQKKTKQKKKNQGKQNKTKQYKIQREKQISREILINLNQGGSNLTIRSGKNGEVTRRGLLFIPLQTNVTSCKEEGRHNFM